MSKVGQNRKAAPLHIWEVFREVGGDFFVRAYPKPRRSETFNDYFERIDWKEEALFKALIGVGCTVDGSPVDQREYSLALELLTESLYKIRAILYKKWPK